MLTTRSYETRKNPKNLFDLSTFHVSRATFIYLVCHASRSVCLFVRGDTLRNERAHSVLNNSFKGDFHFQRKNSVIVQGGKKSLSVAITDEFYTFDLMEKQCKETCRKIEPQGRYFSFLFFSHYILLVTKIKLFRENRVVLLKNGKKFLSHLTVRARPNSDFMILVAWMSILRNFPVRFHQHLPCHSCRISVSLNNLTVNVIRTINATKIIKSLLELTCRVIVE